MTRRASAEEEGSAAVLGLVVVGLLVFVALAGGVVAATVLAHRRAQDAADLAALAGASALQQGDDACPAAGDVAGDNGAHLLSCTVAGWTVTVRAEAATGPILGRTRWTAGEARAGPVDEAPP